MMHIHVCVGVSLSVFVYLCVCLLCVLIFFRAQPGYGLRAAGGIRDYFLAGKRIRGAQGTAWPRLIFCQQPRLSLNPSL